MLKPKDREELIIRTNEAVHNIWRIVEKVEQHQRAQNNSIAEALQIGYSNRAWGKIMKWVIGGIVLIAIALVTTHAQGLW